MLAQKCSKKKPNRAYILEGVFHIQLPPIPNRIDDGGNDDDGQDIGTHIFCGCETVKGRKRFINSSGIYLDIITIIAAVGFRERARACTTTIITRYRQVIASQ